MAGDEDQQNLVKLCGCIAFAMRKAKQVRSNRQATIVEALLSALQLTEELVQRPVKPTMAVQNKLPLLAALAARPAVRVPQSTSATQTEPEVQKTKKAEVETNSVAPTSGPEATFGTKEEGDEASSDHRTPAPEGSDTCVSGLVGVASSHKDDGVCGSASSDIGTPAPEGRDTCVSGRVSKDAACEDRVPAPEERDTCVSGQAPDFMVSTGSLCHEVEEEQGHDEGGTGSDSAEGKHFAEVPRLPAPPLFSVVVPTAELMGEVVYDLSHDVAGNVRCSCGGQLKYGRCQACGWMWAGDKDAFRRLRDKEALEKSAPKATTWQKIGKGSGFSNFGDTAAGTDTISMKQTEKLTWKPQRRS